MDSLKFWTIDGFEISSYKYSLEERKNKSYYTSGSDNTNKCKYTYNELGFRGESIFNQGFKIMSLGCSITEGVGVNDEETWPRQFSKLFKEGVDLNFGTGGRSNDFISRCLLTFFDLIKPDLVLIMYTYLERKEIYTLDNKIEPYIPNSIWGFLKETDDGRNIQTHMNQLQNDNSDFINWYKNHLLIKYFLDSKKCNWLWDGNLANIKYADINKFDGYSFNTFVDKGVDNKHPGPLHHKIYAEKLRDFVGKKYPVYLNKIL